MRPLMVMLLAAFLLAATAGPAMTQSPSASSKPAGQRTEVADHGFAVTFPNDWAVREGPVEWPTTTGRRTYTSAIPMFRQLLVADGPVRPESFSEQCEVQSFAYAELTPLDIAYSLSVTSCGPVTPMPAHVSLPAGEAAQLHCQRRLDDHWSHQSWYVLATDPGYVWLWCRSVDYRPDDRWRSIAETFEFLPAEE